MQARHSYGDQPAVAATRPMFVRPCTGKKPVHSWRDILPKSARPVTMPGFRHIELHQMREKISRQVSLDEYIVTLFRVTNSAVCISQ